MKMHFYGFANAVQNAVSPTPPNQLTDWERKALQGLRAQGYRIAEQKFDKNLLELTGNVTKKFNLSETPKIIVYRQEYPNAAMLSYSNTMFISTALMEILNKDEMEAVIGHELGHRKQQASLITAGLTSTVVGLVGGNFLASRLSKGINTLFGDKIPNSSLLENTPRVQDFSKGTARFLTKSPLAVTIAFGFMSGLVGTLLAYPMAAFKRHMELDADKQSSEITGKPIALVTALQKLQNRAREIHGKVIPATDPQMANAPIPANPETPRTEFQKWNDEKLRSHPDFVTREKQLRDIAAKQQGQLGHV